MKGPSIAADVDEQMEKTAAATHTNQFKAESYIRRYRRRGTSKAARANVQSGQRWSRLELMIQASTYALCAQ